MILDFVKTLLLLKFTLSIVEPINYNDLDEVAFRVYPGKLCLSVIDTLLHAKRLGRNEGPVFWRCQHTESLGVVFNYKDVNSPYAVRRTTQVVLSRKAEESPLWVCPVGEGATHPLRNIRC
jgi:hypothetical protein